MEEYEQIKKYGELNFCHPKSKYRRKCKRNCSDKRHRKVSTNSFKCCSICRPTFSIRGENKKQINNLLRYGLTYTYL